MSSLLRFTRCGFIRPHWWRSEDGRREFELVWERMHHAAQERGLRLLDCEIQCKYDRGRKMFLVHVSDTHLSSPFERPPPGHVRYGVSMLLPDQPNWWHTEEGRAFMDTNVKQVRAACDATGVPLGDCEWKVEPGGKGIIITGYGREAGKSAL